MSHVENYFKYTHQKKESFIIYYILIFSSSENYSLKPILQKIKIN